MTPVPATNLREISYETTWEVRDTCLCLATQRAARALARRFDDAFRALGLTNGQFSLLMALNRPKPPSIGPLAEFLAMDRTTLTAALKPLERRKLIRVAVDPDDRRGRLLHLTANGRKLLAKALPIWRENHQTLDRQMIIAASVREDLAKLARVSA
ncbi:MAG TPA: MarR family transcriptional regulator [Rhizomicrobium sp.]|jgi:DNA-binding MarR family transcriptional regulator|nr:MarR family transcriptional regulator [Rhizomicrobium sp.]